MADKENGPGNGLEKLVIEFGQLVGFLAENVEATLRSNGQESDAKIAETLRAALGVQTAALATNFSDALKGLSADNRKLVDRRADETGALGIARMTRDKLAKKEIDLTSIIHLLEPIKKIIDMVLDLLKKLNVSQKIIDWIEYLIPFINNLLEILNGLLGHDAGMKAVHAHAMMNRHMREFYRTQAARRLFDRAQGPTSEPDDDKVV